MAESIHISKKRQILKSLILYFQMLCQLFEWSCSISIQILCFSITLMLQFWDLTFFAKIMNIFICRFFNFSEIPPQCFVLSCKLLDIFKSSFFFVFSSVTTHFMNDYNHSSVSFLLFSEIE